MKLTCAIIDDEPLAVELLESYVRKTPFLELKGAYNGGITALEALKTEPVDLLFCDIQMPGLSGMELSRMLPADTRVIFTTAFSRYAVEGFRVNAVDYLLKPIKEEEVRRALEKLRRLSGLERSRYSERVERLAERANERQQVFLVRVRDKFIPLQRERIAYCYTSDERVTACTLDGEKYPLDKPLETLQTLLPASDFFRANRQFIVARQAVAEIAVWFGSRLALRLSVETPERIVISKARVPIKTLHTSVHPR